MSSLTAYFKHRRPNQVGVVTAILTVASYANMTVRSEAAALSWSAAGGGSAGTSANWNPVQIPVAADDLTFNLNASYTVNFPAGVPTSRTHTYRDGVVTLSNSATHTITNGLTVGSLNLDDATMTLTTGTVNVNAASVVGNATGSIGRINVNDDDADLNITNGSDLTIGNNGNGTLSITAIGRVSVADQFIAGSNSSSVATVTVSGFSLAPIGVSELEITGLGQSRIGAGGDATMTISNGGVGDFAGDLVIANGSASTSSVTVQTAGLLDARLIVDGDLLVGRNISATIAAGNGTVNLNTGGSVTIGGDTFLGDPDGGTGLLQMGGGTFSGVGPINVLPGSTISGTGTIIAPISNSGNINPTGAAGLTLGGILSNTTSNLVVGTKIHFSNTGGYTGSGEVDADITGDTNALITATGTLSIGKNTTSGYSYNGQLDVGGSIVTLVDSNGAVLGGKTTINSGRIEAPSGIGIQNGAEIEGDGLFVADIINSGILDPHTTNNGIGGLFTVQGDLHFNPTGKMEMDLKGAPGSANDRINASGTAAFGGTMRVKLPTGFVPKVGQQFIAVNATQGRTDVFDAIEPPSPGPCNQVTFVMVYSSTAAIVLIRPPLGCTALGDLNSDGGCNGPDIQLFMNAITGGVYVPCADLNGDCQNTVDDVTIFINCLL